MAELTVTADRLRQGDSIYGRNVHGTTSLTVTGLRTDGGTVTVFTRLGDRDYRADELISIYRD